MAWLEDLKNSYNRGNSMLRKLIFINIGVFLLVNLVRVFAFFITGDASDGNQVNHWIFLPPALSDLVLRPWSIITYMFAHQGLFHILFNMLILYYLGSIYQEYLGNKKLFRVYFWGGIAGGLLFIIGMNLIPALNSPAMLSKPLLGASAGVLAVVAGIATLLPDYQIRIFVFNIKLKWIALGYFALSIFNIPGDNPGGNIAHVGGVVFGYLYIKHLQNSSFLDRWGDAIESRINKIFKNKKKDERKIYNTYTVHMKEETKGKPDQSEIDAILDKINKSGYDSLSRKEREMLFKASKED